MERDDEGVVERLEGMDRPSVNCAEVRRIAPNCAELRASITCFSRMIHLVRVCGFDASSFFLLTI